MNSALILGIVLLATFGLAALAFAGLVALAWLAGLSRARLTSADLLVLRLFPVVGALLVAVTIVLPAFLCWEPHRDREAAGPLLLVLAAFSLLTLGHGIWRGWRAWAEARSLLRQCGCAHRWVAENGQSVQIVDVADPIVAVIGGWRPQVIVAQCIIAACSRDEFRQVVAHEAAHVFARDNLKLLLLLACPDVLGWTALGGVLSERWRTEAEFAADQRATGEDPHKRIALASALIKVARLFDTRQRARHALTMSVALDNVEGRVRQLLAPPRVASGTISKLLASFVLVMPLLMLPLYASVHELIETLVRFGL
ncbi:MAG TPA: M56 family metallopeptidase [Steroidobacteraceae bacterium]|nr:M56 family metallopeptidase [Steroidobacteraceae bacterium]